MARVIDLTPCENAHGKGKRERRSERTHDTSNPGGLDEQADYVLKDVPMESHETIDPFALASWEKRTQTIADGTTATQADVAAAVRIATSSSARNSVVGIGGIIKMQTPETVTWVQSCYALLPGSLLVERDTYLIPTSRQRSALQPYCRLVRQALHRLGSLEVSRNNAR